MNPSRYSRLMMVLVPVMAMVCALAFPRPAHTGQPAAFHLPVRTAGAIPEQTAGFRSLSHPFAPPAPVGNGNTDFHILDSERRTAPAAVGPNGTWYSAGVNNVLCSLLLPNETWLGTEFGVKRLNLQTRQTQHYTTLDGLPYSHITAIAGQNGVVVCAAIRQEPSGAGNAPFYRSFAVGQARVETTALCRFDALSGKWKVLDEDRREYVTADPPNGMEAKAIPLQSVVVNERYACLVPGIIQSGKPIALLCRLSDGFVDNLVAPEFLRQPFAVTSAQMDARYLWFGSSRGLLRCDLKTREWETLLPDAMIYSSAQAADGSLWVLAKTFGPFRADIQQGSIRDTRWEAVHIQEGQPPRPYLLKSWEEPQRAWAPAFLENITLADGKVWATVNRFGAGIHGQLAYLPDVLSLAPQTGQVTTQASISGDAKYDEIPTSVLVNSHTGWGILTPLRRPARFPGWICEAEAGEAAMLTMPRHDLDTITPQRMEWHFGARSNGGQSGNFLQREAASPGAGGNRVGELYAPPFVRVDAQEETWWPTAMKDPQDGRDKVYFLSGSFDIKLRVWDRASNTVSTPIEVTAALKRYKPQWPGGTMLLPGRGCLWIGTGEHVLRYDLASGRVEAAQEKTPDVGGYVPRHALLSVEGDTVWVKGAPNLLYTANPRVSSSLTPVALPPFPGDLERSRDKLALFALEDHIAWFTGLSFIAPNKRVLIGYNLLTRTWTKPIDASLPLISAGQTISTYKQGTTRWFPAYSREASAYGYDMASGQWTTLPLAPASENPWRVLLVGADARHFWYCDSARLYRLDREEKTWHYDALPFAFSDFQYKGVTPSGETLCFGSGSGAWLLDTTTGKWAQSPGVPVTSEDMYYQVKAVDAQAVWLDSMRAGVSLVARFDRQAHVWKTWTSADGVPPGYSRMIPDGSSCWLLAEGILYHLNTQTNHWDNISRRLYALKPDGTYSAEPETSPQTNEVISLQPGAQLPQANREAIGIRQILVEGEDVWLVPGSFPNQPYQMPAAIFAPLYHYEKTSQRFTIVSPAPGKTLTPGALTATDRGLLFAAREGVYRLDGAGGEWRPVAIPALPAAFPPLLPAVAREDQNNYWILGDEHALRFRKPRR